MSDLSTEESRTAVDPELPPDSGFVPRFDRLAVDLSVAFSQHLSRRGFIAKAGKAMLYAMGASAIAALPIAKPEEASAAVTCSYWSLCGLCGRICTCCNGSHPLNWCPSGTSVYSYWSKCCKDPGDNTWVRIRYWDCCGGSASCGSCLNCSNNCPQPAWCNGTTYRCTAIVDAGPC
jgi:methylamine dehydrogenase light chain